MYVEVGYRNNSGGQLCRSFGVDAPLADGATELFQCIKPIFGRYVYVKKAIVEHMAICELKVFGQGKGLIPYLIVIYWISIATSTIYVYYQ